jgi:hypothetical protein
MKMKLKHKKAFLLLGVFTLFLIALSSCVDMPTKGVTPPPLVSTYRFINAAPDLANVGIAVEGTSVGTIDFKANTSYAQYESGTKNVALSNGESLIISMATDYQGTICLLPQEAGVRAFLRANEMRVFDPADTGAKGKLRVIHLADAPEVDITATSSDTTVSWAGVEYKNIGAYRSVHPGNYTVTVAAAGATVLTFQVTVGSERNSAFIMGSAAGGTLSAVGLKDN